MNHLLPPVFEKRFSVLNMFKFDDENKWDDENIFEYTGINFPGSTQVEPAMFIDLDEARIKASEIISSEKYKDRCIIGI